LEIQLAEKHIKETASIEYKKNKYQETSSERLEQKSSGDKNLG
jgi:hypothetical protein